MKRFMLVLSAIAITLLTLTLPACLNADAIQRQPYARTSPNPLMYAKAAQVAPDPHVTVATMPAQVVPDPHAAPAVKAAQFAPDPHAYPIPDQAAPTSGTAEISAGLVQLVAPHIPGFGAGLLVLGGILGVGRKITRLTPSKKDDQVMARIDQIAKHVGIPGTATV